MLNKNIEAGAFQIKSFKLQNLVICSGRIKMEVLADDIESSFCFWSAAFLLFIFRYVWILIKNF